LLFLLPKEEGSLVFGLHRKEEGEVPPPLTHPGDRTSHGQGRRQDKGHILGQKGREQGF
jgi:hypothetical protein